MTKLRFRSLHTKLQIAWLSSVVLAVATVALAARLSTSYEITQIQAQSQEQIQSIAAQVGAETNRRVVVFGAHAELIADSSASPDTSSGPHVLFSVPPGEIGPPPQPDTAQGGPVVTVVAGTPDPTGPLMLTGPPDVPGPPAPESGFSVAAPLNSAESLFQLSVNRALVAGVVVGGLSAIVFALWFSRRILRPIDALTEAATRMAAGRLEQAVPEEGTDELAALGQAFNRMAASVARTEQLRRTMVSDVAHELRTPLTNVRGYLEALQDGVLEPSAEVIDCLCEEAALLGQLVHDLQDLSLAESGHLALKPEPLDPATVMRGVAQAVQGLADQKGLRLELRCDDTLPTVHGDAARLAQVMRNLVANAIAHTPAGGHVCLEARTKGGRLELAVVDTGEGIPPEHLPHIFERFYRVDQSRTRSTGGAGLGLAIAQQLVKNHGGTIDVQSNLGRGTTFRVTLPAWQAV